MTHAILIIEDERVLAKNIKTYLERHGHAATVVHSGEEGIARLDGAPPDVVVLDFHLPGMDGLEVLSRIRSRNRAIKVIMITGDATVKVAVQAMKLGAFDYLSKPVVLRELRLLVDRALGIGQAGAPAHAGPAAQPGGSELDKLSGESGPMLALKEAIRRLAEAERLVLDNDLPTVLIIGETGAGKECVARAVHFEGARKAQPFIEINCASIPPQMLEAELFGHERGAFTDARERKYGLIEAADGGTLFLDEIGELELPMQAKLLKVLEEKKLRRLGGLQEHRIDFRVIAATNQDLQQRVREGRFRSDLYYRLKMVQFEVPPLRDRGDDVLLLARSFLALHGTRYRKPGLFFTPCAQRALRAWHWPGNVRELRNMLEQIALMARGEAIAAEHLPLPPPAVRASAPAAPAALPGQEMNLEGMERQYLLAALGQARWNVTRAAKSLGLSRDAMRYRIEKYSIKGDS
ncbi:sigma-54 dependent transcriptional regulator [Massilia sp. Mn16-1_5]|uniref:sigma-54-dependent transcriptional regulator n=1 Tax=Massilia sp. Mn16-1_5 TaxID=2079199 RepID=UPI00109E57EE|nr:sigma-54 dependent transcriptional regulator [Massilia sp. Mn16-1_5]THC45462.1 sigma-54-dependent Fis family transcriptional regulator [Massilia sp. Mn16-1_5]